MKLLKRQKSVELGIISTSSKNFEFLLNNSIVLMVCTRESKSVSKISSIFECLSLYYSNHTWWLTLNLAHPDGVALYLPVSRIRTSNTFLFVNSLLISIWVEELFTSNHRYLQANLPNILYLYLHSYLLVFGCVIRHNKKSLPDWNFIPIILGTHRDTGY